MNNELLEVGEKIYISFNSLDEITLDDFRYLSQIVDRVDENQIIISSPFYKSNILELEIGEIYSILYINDNGLNIMEAESFEIIFENNVILYKVKILSDPIKLQRRDFYRLSTNMQIIYSYIKDNKEYYGQGITKDISGGGIKFLSSEEFKIDDSISIFIRLNNNSEINAKCKVVRCYKYEMSKYEVGVEFFNIPQNKREELIRYIFLIQRENLREKNNI